MSQESADQAHAFDGAALGHHLPVASRRQDPGIHGRPVLDFAGAYEEDAVLRFAERVEGSPNFRTALPVGELMLFLRQQGVAV